MARCRCGVSSLPSPWTDETIAEQVGLALAGELAVAGMVEHYREFLIVAFYWPVFFSVFRKHRRLRPGMRRVNSSGSTHRATGR